MIGVARRVRGRAVAFASGALVSCGADPEVSCDVLEPGVERFDAPADVPSNVLLVILDDVGAVSVGAYDLAGQAGRTPTLDALAAEGVLFERAYAQPWCSPTRATILTGQYSRRYGIGRALEVQAEDLSLPTETVSLPELIRDGSRAYATGVFGKWHLTSAADDALTGPQQHGFDVFRGTIANLAAGHAYDGSGQTYSDWEKVTDGQLSRVTGYVTSDVVDDAIAWTAATPEPWLAWVAFHAAHTPWHVPPAHLHAGGDLEGEPTSARIQAMIEAMDAEIGRVLASLDPETRARTTVIVVGDNGSTDEAYTGELTGLGGKSGVGELGVHVPLIVAGPLVGAPGTRSEALVHTVDLFPTIAEIAGVDVAASGVELDGVSFLRHVRDPSLPSSRSWVYAESFEPNGFDLPTTDRRTVRDARYKLDRIDGVDRFYDLGDEPTEGGALGSIGRRGEVADAYRRLLAIMDQCGP